jgi:hypothetical protein
VAVDRDDVGLGRSGGGYVVRGRGRPPPVECVLEAAGPGLVDRPETAFVALHAAVALAAAGDQARLARLRGHCQDAFELTVRTTVVTVCDALLAAGEHDWARAARLLTDVLPGLPRVGGSAAQREIVEETLLFCLVSDGQAAQALALLDGRLDRRTSSLDRRRRASLARTPTTA